MKTSDHAGYDPLADVNTNMVNILDLVSVAADCNSAC